MTDEEIIMRHDSAVRPRARMELKIVNQLIKSAEEAKYTLKVHDEEVPDGETIKDLLFNLDDAHVAVYDQEGLATGLAVGWVRLVFGNDGYDLINDYTTGLEDFLRPCNDLALRLENGLE